MTWQRALILRLSLSPWLWVRTPKTWISVGCGTARDIEFVTGHVKASGTKVYLVDLSDALLEMARERVVKLGLASQVVLVEGDINDAKVRRCRLTSG